MPPAVASNAGPAASAPAKAQRYKGHPFPRLQAPTSKPKQHDFQVQGAPSVRADTKRAAASLLRELGFLDVDTPGSETKQLLDAVHLEGNDTPFYPSVVRLEAGISGVHVALSVVANKLTKLKYGQWVISWGGEGVAKLRATLSPISYSRHFANASHVPLRLIRYQDVSLNTDHAFQTLNSQYAIHLKGVGNVTKVIESIEDDDAMRPPDYHFRYVCRQFGTLGKHRRMGCSDWETRFVYRTDLDWTGLTLDSLSYWSSYLWGNVFETRDNDWIYFSAKFDKPVKLLGACGFSQKEAEDLLKGDGKIIFDPKKLLDSVADKVKKQWDAKAIEAEMTKKHHCAVVPLSYQDFLKSEQVGFSCGPDHVDVHGRFATNPHANVQSTGKSPLGCRRRRNRPLAPPGHCPQLARRRPPRHPRSLPSPPP